MIVRCLPLCAVVCDVRLFWVWVFVYRVCALSPAQPKGILSCLSRVSYLSARWRLRSTVSWTCVVTRTYSTFGDRAFAAAGPGLQNSLPSHLKDADISYSEFQRSLKTFLFLTVGPRHSVNCINCAD